jgi:GTP-binding protein
LQINPLENKNVQSHWNVKIETTAFLGNQFPAEDEALAEIALAGRSNVGKSTLVNALLGVKLAHVASSPGKTRSINFFIVESARKQEGAETAIKKFRVVDLPGYGYASRSKGEKKEWSKLTTTYMQNRSSLCLVLHLVDMRHGLFDSDRRLQEWLLSMNKKFMVVFTKADKISRGSRKGLVQKYVSDGLYSNEMPIITSGETRDGIRELREIIEKYAK